MRQFERYTMPLGMIGSAAYLIHTILGRMLWQDYNPITTDISSLTAASAPNREFLMVFTTIYGIATILFVLGMVKKAFREYRWGVRTGWIILLVMNLVSMFGYSLFPLTGDKTVMNFQNAMHIAVTIIVVFTTIAGGFFLAFGYLKQEKMKRLGLFTLIMAVIITLTGALNPVGMANNLNIMGLTERLTIYSLQFLMFTYSAYYTYGVSKKA